MKEQMSGCSSSVRSKKETQIFQGCKKLVGTVLGAETVLNDSHALPCGSTPRSVQHRAAAASVGSGNLSAKSFSKGGSTPRSSSMIDTLGPVNSDFKKDSVRFAGKTNLDPLTKVFSWQELGTRLGVLSRLRSGHSSRQVDSVVRGSQVALQLNRCSHSVSSHNIELVRDLSSCHLAPASKSAPLPSSVSVGCGRRARWSGRGSALCCSRCGVGLVGGNSSTCGECLLLASGNDPWNSCVGHGEGQDAEHVHEVAGGTKSQRTRTGSKVRQSLEGLMPVGRNWHRTFEGCQERCMLRHGMNAVVQLGMGHGWLSLVKDVR